MSILGNLKLKKRTRRVVVGVDRQGNPVELEVRAPRLGEIDSLTKRIPEPVPPIKKDGQGRPIVLKDDRGYVLKDEHGSPLVARDHTNSDHIKRLARWDQALTIAMIVDCLGDQIDPEADPEDFGANLIDYYHAVWSELEDAGLDAGSFRALSAAAVELGGPMSSEELDDAKVALALDEETQAAVRKELKEASLREGKGKLELPEGNSE